MKENSRRAIKLAAAALKGTKRPDVSARMRANNPMSNPATVEKARQSRIGKTFLSRGGNGKLTTPQLILHDFLCPFGYEIEYSIRTLPVKHLFQSVPNNYKVDLAHPESKTAIEVDGNSHKTKKWKFLDKRKPEILAALGWSVVRIWNEEILKDRAEAVASIVGHITYKYALNGELWDPFKLSCAKQ